jgi:hypothetical protein
VAPVPRGASLTLIPSVHYVRNGEFTLAYQLTGTGPKDIVCHDVPARGPAAITSTALGRTTQITNEIESTPAVW